jgi:hypothetical protein
MKTFSPAALGFCIFCRYVWAIAVMGACTYVVFWLNQSGCWYILALVLFDSLGCAAYRSPEQIAADKEIKTDDEDE